MKNYNRILIIIGIIFITLLANAFYPVLGSYTFIAFLGLIIVASIFFVGFEKDRGRYNKDVILLILIYSFAYYIVTYILGLFTGFNANAYSLTFLNIIRNSFPLIVIIVLSEFLRYILITKAKDRLIVLGLLIFIFSFLDVTLILRGYNLANTEELVKFVVLIAFPVISKNF